MGRDKRIRVSQDEKDLLKETALAMYGTDEIFYAVIVEQLCKEKLEELEENDG